MKKEHLITIKTLDKLTQKEKVKEIKEVDAAEATYIYCERCGMFLDGGLQCVYAEKDEQGHLGSIYEDNYTQIAIALDLEE